jgi:hypothetical protein
MRLTAALTAALIFAAALAVPALGGPSLAAIAAKAAKALKLAHTADKRSKQALVLARRATGTTGTGTTGATGTSGQTGGAGTGGPPGPQGPPGPPGAQKIDFRAAAGTPDTKVLDFGGLVITARCDSGPNLSVKASSTVADSELHVAGVTHDVASGSTTPVYTENDHLGPSSTSLSFPTSNFQGTFTYSTPAGAVVTGTVAAEQTAFNGNRGCWFGGWALHDPS